MIEPGDIYSQLSEQQGACAIVCSGNGLQQMQGFDSLLISFCGKPGGLLNCLLRFDCKPI
jgi:hypothetical protein